MNRRTLPRQSGFTLIETMMTLVIVAILASLALPFMRDLVLNQRAKTTAYDLYGTLVYARSEAVKRGATISVQPSAAGWIEGWSVIQGATALRSHALSGELNLAGPVGAISFTGNGRLSGAGNAQFVINYAGGASPRCVILDSGGRPSIRVDRNNDGNCVNG